MFESNACFLCLLRYEYIEGGFGAIVKLILVAVVTVVTPVTQLTSLIYKLTFHFTNKYLVRIFVCRFKKV